jgi:hypothetical protein
MISVVQRLCRRVTKWRDQHLVPRWVGVLVTPAARVPRVQDAKAYDYVAREIAGTPPQFHNHPDILHPGRYAGWPDAEEMGHASLMLGPEKQVETAREHRIEGIDRADADMSLGNSVHVDATGRGRRRPRQLAALSEYS